MSLQRAALLAAAAVFAAAPGLAQDQRAAARPQASQSRQTVDVPRVHYTAFTLANGLRVILHEDHSSPIVALELWYNVGSKHDPRDMPGLAHIFEHLMDEGTRNMPSGEFKRVIQSAGGSYQALTSNDWTRYLMNMPSNHLETALWLEAERMVNLSIDSVRFNRERDAARNEYRDRVLNVAVGNAQVAVTEALFAGGAYASPVGGTATSLDAATSDDLRRFYETYYVPNNAVLVVAGDLNTADARRKIEKHFSPIPRGKLPPAPSSLGTLSGEKRLVVEHPSGVRQLWLVWRGAGALAPDRTAATALSSIITERLRRLTLEERRLSQSVNPGLNANFELQEAGIFQIALWPRDTASATELERLADSVVASIKTDGVTEAEVRRWVASNRLQTLSAMQSIQTKAEYLADGLLIMKNPLAYFSATERSQAVTPAAIQAVARKYLTGDRVVLSIVPTGKLELISRPELPYVNATKKGS